MVSAVLRKNLLIGFNVLYAAVAIVVLIVGTQSDDDNGMRTIFFVSGGLALAVAAVGLLAAIIQNVYVLRTFGVLLGVIVGLNIISIISYIRLLASAKDNLNILFQHYETVSSAKSATDLVQSKLQCCGVESPDDWTKYYPKGKFPQSCCPPQLHDDSEVCTADAAYDSGCLGAMKRLYAGYGVGVFITAVLQIMAIVLSCSLPEKKPLASQAMMP